MPKTIAKCSNCKQEKQIKMKCNFCEDGYALCEECAREHRSWCKTRDDWQFIE